MRNIEVDTFFDKILHQYKITAYYSPSPSFFEKRESKSSGISLTEISFANYTGFFLGFFAFFLTAFSTYFLLY